MRRIVRRNGFTAVELLVAVFVLLVLATILIPYVQKLREMDRRTRCVANLSQIRDALHRYAGENHFQYPRVVYDGVHAPNSYTCFTGPDAADPFTANSKVRPNDVTASLWLLIRTASLINPNVFICPSSGDESDGDITRAARLSNFRSGMNLSYGYSSPFSSAPGYKMNDTRRSDFAILADKGPMPALRSVDGALAGPPGNAPPLAMAVLNSRNHAGAGQNVLFADDSVRFERTPYCGVGRSGTTPGDNIYTALAPTPLNGQTPPADGIGFWSPSIGPAWESDSYMVPIEGESPR